MAHRAPIVANSHENTSMSISVNQTFVVQGGTVNVVRGNQTINSEGLFDQRLTTSVSSLVFGTLSDVQP